MDLLEWIAARERDPGGHLTGITLIQKASGLPGEDPDTARRWDGVARAAARLHKLGFIEWTYVRPFNEVGETPYDAMDQQYVQRVRDIMLTGAGYAALKDRAAAEPANTINIGQLALGNITNVDVFVILEAADRLLDQLDAPTEVKDEARGILQRMQSAGQTVASGAAIELLARELSAKPSGSAEQVWANGAPQRLRACSDAATSTWA